MKLERVVIHNGPVALAGLVYRPTRAAREGSVVLSHGLTASKESLDRLAGYLSGRGWPCLTFDFRGHKLGGSTGTLHDVEEAVGDLEAAMRWAGVHLRRPKVFLVGHSMGGLVSVATAARNPDVAGVASIAAGPNALRGFRSPVGQAMMVQRADYVFGAPAAHLLAQLDHLADRVEALRNRPALFVAARGDVLMKAERVRAWALLAGPDAVFAEVEGSHLEAPDRARAVVANWLERQAAVEERTAAEP